MNMTTTMLPGKRPSQSSEQHQDGKRPMLSPPTLIIPHNLVTGEMCRLLQQQMNASASPTNLAQSNVVPLKEKAKAISQKTKRKPQQRATRNLTWQKSIEKEMRIMKEKLLEDSEKDRHHLEKEMKNLRDFLLEEKEKDRQCWEKGLKSLKETLSAEREKDRQCFIAQSNKLRSTEIQRNNNIRDSIDDIRDPQASDSENNIKDAKYGNGSHESQVSEGGEAELVEHYKNCTKNPGHKGLKTFHEFNTSHLPKGFQDQDIVEFSKATADLTVRIDLKVTSLKRPEYWPKTKVPFAFHNLRGSKTMRTGTGLVCMVEKWTENHNKGTCKCRKCLHSNSPSKVWGVVRMLSALEVVFDWYEAKHATCRLFYNREDGHFLSLDGDWMLDSENKGQGWIVLKCVTCDQHVLDSLEKIWTQWRFNLWYKVNNKYKNSRDRDRFTFIVSHPHGGPKKISVGKWLNKSEVSKGWSKYTYTTVTCPGSSGAYVHLLGYNKWDYPGGLVHSGVNSKGVNASCAGLDME